MGLSNIGSNSAKWISIYDIDTGEYIIKSLEITDPWDARIIIRENGKPDYIK